MKCKICGLWSEGETVNGLCEDCEDYEDDGLDGPMFDGPPFVEPWDWSDIFPCDDDGY